MLGCNCKHYIELLVVLTVLLENTVFVFSLEVCGSDPNCPGDCYSVRRDCSGSSNNCRDVTVCYSCCGSVCCPSDSDTCCGGDSGVCCGALYKCHVKNETESDPEYGCEVNARAAVLFIVLGTIIPVCICIGMAIFCIYIRSSNVGRAKVAVQSFPQPSYPSVQLGHHLGGIPVAYAEPIPSNTVPTDTNIPVARATIAPTVVYNMHMQPGQLMQQTHPQYH
jgi:hypothetical protein